LFVGGACIAVHQHANFCSLQRAAAWLHQWNPTPECCTAVLPQAIIVVLGANENKLPTDQLPQHQAGAPVTGASPYPASLPNPYPHPVTGPLEGQVKPMDVAPSGAGTQYPPQQHPVVAAQGAAPYPPAAGYRGTQPQAQAAPGPYPAAANAAPAGYPVAQ
jgi:hypothetical protein